MITTSWPDWVSLHSRPFSTLLFWLCSMTTWWRLWFWERDAVTQQVTKGYIILWFCSERYYHSPDSTSWKKNESLWLWLYISVEYIFDLRNKLFLTKESLGHHHTYSAIYRGFRLFRIVGTQKRIKNCKCGTNSKWGNLGNFFHVRFDGGAFSKYNSKSVLSMSNFYFGQHVLPVWS